MGLIDIDGALIQAYIDIGLGLATAYEGEEFDHPTAGSQATITASTISAAAADNSFNDSASGFITAGFGVGQKVMITGFTGDTNNNIDEAIITAVVAGKITIGGTDGDVIVNDAAGESVTIKTVGSDWAAVFMLPGVTDFNSLGDNGEDLHLGIMQIDFNTPHGEGRAALIAYAQQVRDEFVGGKGYVRNSQNVRIDTVERTAVTEADGWMRISVSVNWEAVTIRPAI